MTKADDIAAFARTHPEWGREDIALHLNVRPSLVKEVSDRYNLNILEYTLTTDDHRFVCRQCGWFRIAENLRLSECPKCGGAFFFKDFNLIILGKDKIKIESAAKEWRTTWREQMSVKYPPGSPDARGRGALTKPAHVAQRRKN